MRARNRPAAGAVSPSGRLSLSGRAGTSSGAPRRYDITTSRRSVQRRLPALQDRGRVIGSHGPRLLHPWTELRLGELAVALLERDAVGIAALQMLDQHLAGDLVLATPRDVEVDLDERVRVPVEHRR